MEYRILINEESKPVLLEVPTRPVLDSHVSMVAHYGMLLDYQRAVDEAISDNSKHIQFKDEESVWEMIENHSDRLVRKRPVGQTFPLPTGYKVSFEEDGEQNRDGKLFAILSKLEERSEEIKNCKVLDRIKFKGNRDICANDLEKVVAPSEEVKQAEEETVSKDENYEELVKTLHGRIRGTDQEYILCAANWYLSPSNKSEHLPKNINYGVVVCGRRHHNIFAAVAKISEDFMNDTKSMCEQGFMTSKDRFVNRKEAGEIAFKAGQTKDLRTCLFSEDLY